MEKKLTAYQKLKSENLKLKQDIYVLARYEKSKSVSFLDYFETKQRWNTIFDCEEYVWCGTTQASNGE